MHRITACAAIIILMFQAALGLADEVQVRARVDRTTVSTGESLQMEVIIRNGKGEVDLSGITDFNILSRGTRSNVQIVNGSMSQEQIHAYLLIPQRKGAITIPSLSVDIDGTTYRTDPIRIQVKGSVKGSGAGTAAETDVWVSASVSEPSPFQGQQFIYTFRLTNSVQINNAKFLPPEFDGFSAKEIKDRRSYRKTINGRDHMMTEVYFILTPLSAGTHTIEPAVLQVGILRQDKRRRRSAFDDFFNRGTVEPRVLETEAVAVSVRALPPMDTALGFSGLVGQFDLKATLETTELTVGDSATLTVTVEGEGNVMDAEAPQMEIPPAFKQYADHPEEEVRADRQGFSGRKVFRTALVPTESGSFVLPPIQLVYFDIGQRAYRTLTATVPQLSVLPSQTDESAPITISADPVNPLKKRVQFTGRDILPPKESLESIAHRAPMVEATYLISIALPMLVFLGATLVQRMRRKDSGPSAVMAARARQSLEAAHSESGQMMLSSLYRAITAAILSTAGRIGEALTWKEAHDLLNQSGHGQWARQAADLLEQIESYKFSGARLDNAQKVDLLNQTQKLIGALLP